MPANTQPIFTRQGLLGRAVWTSSDTANTDSDGSGTIGTDMKLLCSADSTNGSYINRVRFYPAATAAATATTGTVIRVFVSTQSSGSTTSSNTCLIAEITASSVTAASASAAVLPLDYNLGFVLPAGTHLLFSMHHAAAASTIWHASAYGGDY